MGKNRRLVIIYMLIFAAIIALVIVFADDWFGGKQTPTASLSRVTEWATDNKIASVEIVDDRTLNITTAATVTPDTGGDVAEGGKVKSTISTEYVGEFIKLLKENNVPFVVKYSSGFNWGSFLLTVLPLLMLVALFIFIMRGARGANSQAFNFSRSRARLADGAKPTVTFSDVAGVEEAKQELQEIVEFLKQPEKFLALGARIPRGVLLIGAPGTGKTLLARAIAGEAGVPFFSISGSEFVEMFVGVGASRVRDLFDQAKRNAPCIVFVDEIDAVGRHRGAGLGGGHDEREQTLNQILVEMDGFDTSTNVIVLAATNRPDILDPALLRPGRFDRRVVLDPPDINGRTGILQVHAKGKPLDPSVSLETISRQTVGFSGADLANLVNEAAILAARRNKKTIGMIEFEEAIDRVIAGPEKKSRIISAREKEITAYHEAGHALVARKLPHADPVHKVSIVARGMMGGYTRLLPTEDRNMITRSQLMDRLSVLVAGHVAEEIIFNEKTTGPHDDIDRVTKIARAMVTEYGMSDRLELRTFGHKEELVFLGKEISEQRNYSERVALEIDREVRAIIQKAYDVAKAILLENKAKLVQIAERLIAEESLEGERLEKLFNEPVPTAPAQA
ncbi:MAG: ATP-dependent zinc metalloprotease FtsH [Dehalococcoidia bacterium]|nr:ATP-dependent zinc metalloprotease FtsH [Dehalococcoidia bacterium]